MVYVILNYIVSEIKMGKNFDVKLITILFPEKNCQIILNRWKKL